MNKHFNKESLHCNKSLSVQDSLFSAALHLFKELWKSCLVIPLPCVLTLKSLSLILGFSLDLSLHGNYQVLVTEHSFTATSVKW
jgi:hypothetical protein